MKPINVKRELPETQAMEKNRKNVIPRSATILMEVIEPPFRNHRTSILRVYRIQDSMSFLFSILVLAIYSYWSIFQSKLKASEDHGDHERHFPLLQRKAINDVSRSDVLKSWSFADYDNYYGNKTIFILESSKSKPLTHYGNEKKLFSELTQYNHSGVSQRCSSVPGACSAFSLFVDLLSFLSKNSESLLVPCGPDRIFSHCQQYYLFSINLKDRKCSSYHRQNCECSESYLWSRCT